MTQKRCAGCGRWKKYSDFSKNARASDALQYRCKTCMKGYDAEYRAQEKNKKTAKKRNAIWQRANPRKRKEKD